MAKTKKEVQRNQPVQGRRSPKSVSGSDSASNGLPRLLTVDELAQILRVPRDYVTRRLVFERRITYIKVGRRTLFDEGDVHVFLATQRVTGEE